jgi:hypothetical protein
MCSKCLIIKVSKITKKMVWAQTDEICATEFAENLDKKILQDIKNKN